MERFTDQTQCHGRTARGRMKAHPFYAQLQAIDPVRRTGRVRSIFSTYIEADGPNVPLGSLCTVEARRAGGGLSAFQAEVVGIDRKTITLSPFDEGLATFAGAAVVASPAVNGVPVGRAFLGRALDALGNPLDGGDPIFADAFHPLHGTPTPPLERQSPIEILETGIRAIDGLLTLGQGQRVGLFAPAGAGKTSLLTQIAQQAEADVTILCLVGERGREVEALWTNGLSAQTRARTILVSATSDHSAAMRVRACHYALAHADYWRSKGAHVLLLLDSVTRLAMAMRQMGLAAGEPPTVRAYTPGVFAAIPRIVERCGALKSGGAISALLTVLSETEDMDDPISEMMKSLLDGHILLSRTLAERGHFPAIDIPRSMSRQAEGLVPAGQRAHTRQVVEWLSVHAGAQSLIDAGLHAPGANPTLDRAIERAPDIHHFLQQARDVKVPANDSIVALSRLAGGNR